MPTKKNQPVKAKETTVDFNELTAHNIKSLTTTIQASSDALELLTAKVTSLACHVTALEVILSEVIKITGIDLVQVNSLIRSRINSVDGDLASSNVVVDIAAAIASPTIKKTF
jgi:hypothetical protein